MKRYDFPKLDLHLHLDGAISVNTIFELAKERGIKLPSDNPEGLVPYVTADADISDVNEYLKKFEIPTAVLQDKPALRRVAREAVINLDRQGVRYAEIRFAPQLHTKKNLKQPDAIDAVLEGISEGKMESDNVDIGLILCAMSFGDASLNKKENLETVRLASELKGKGIDGIDLAGAECLCPLSDFSYVFEEAGNLNLAYTCHAGDSDGPESVRTAILDFGARRIGHGHRIIEDTELCRLAAGLGVTLEICLTSNIQCKTQASYETHPAKKLMDMGIKVTLNTDNPVIAGVTLDGEYDFAVLQGGFSKNDLIRANINSVEASFMPPNLKKKLVEELSEKIK
jgi:adenosine deaminase